MQYDPLSGWVEYNTVWSGPFNYPGATDIIVDNSSYPDVEWPMVGPGTGNGWTGEGDWGLFYIGYGGPCNTSNVVGGVDPPFGYWCSSNAPRHIERHECATGMILPDNIGMNLPYHNMSEVIVHSWRPSHWYTFIWESDKSHFDDKTNELIFNKGGFQGGEGTLMGAEWYIEGLYEEITMGMEWYYDKKTNYL
eukprot:CAMPEP_0114684524 /NCGR_PEP_ID=MMETSP0191-20121206/59222_1 /TAXON_ID=126664 /ORGANISM="Sorites sp." /LENGTH=192 /DNA_ID=CAMNT_0001967409 /DNA_START=122 /DNA_END=700 /DNA_ORIENTATION=+